MRTNVNMGMWVMCGRVRWRSARVNFDGARVDSFGGMRESFGGKRVDSMSSVRVNLDCISFMTKYILD